MKRIFFVTMILLNSLGAFSQSLPEDKIIGIWESVDSEVGLKFEIFKSGDRYSGKLLWASTMYEADGKTPKKDFNNPNKSLRVRSRKDMVNIINLKYDDGEYSEGKLYNPDGGDTYSLNAKLKSINEIEFRGYIGFSLLGKTMKFRRINN